MLFKINQAVSFYNPLKTRTRLSILVYFRGEDEMRSFKDELCSNSKFI